MFVFIRHSSVNQDVYMVWKLQNLIKKWCNIGTELRVPFYTFSNFRSLENDADFDILSLYNKYTDVEHFKELTYEWK